MFKKATTAVIISLLVLGITAISVDAQVTIPDTEAIPKKIAHNKVISMIEDSKTVEGEYTKIKV